MEGEVEEDSIPKSKVKFLCSHGGKIISRSSDGLLKYLGGETRVISVHKDITFTKLMEKISSKFERGVIMKYQIIPEELEVFVSVRNDEDVKHMMDECERVEAIGGCKLKAFLFPLNQHYEILRRINTKGALYSTSESSSPKSTSPEGATFDKQLPIHKVRSSPNLNSYNFFHTHHGRPPHDLQHQIFPPVCINGWQDKGRTLKAYHMYGNKYY